MQVEPGLPYGTILPATAELVTSKGTDTANHDTLVVLPASAGQNSTQP